MVCAAFIAGRKGNAAGDLHGKWRFGGFCRLMDRKNVCTKWPLSYWETIFGVRQHQSSRKSIWTFSMELSLRDQRRPQRYIKRPDFRMVQVSLQQALLAFFSSKDKTQQALKLFSSKLI